MVQKSIFRKMTSVDGFSNSVERVSILRLPLGILVLLMLSGCIPIVWSSRSPSQVDMSLCPTKLNNCTLMVKPYLRDVKYMFPTTISDVDGMCKMWSQFVDCVRRYVTTCFSEERRSKFNMAVENSVDTVHAICSSDIVQREYLNNAECFRKVSVENCGSFYSQLIDHVSNPRSHDDHICCSYGQFKRCVHDPLLRECGHRARNLMDHSMGFLISRCSEKAHLSLSSRCPDPPPAITTPDNSDPEQNSFNEIQSGQGPRVDRSFDPDSPHQTTFSSRGFITYTQAPESGSRTSFATTSQLLSSFHLLSYSLMFLFGLPSLLLSSQL